MNNVFLIEDLLSIEALLDKGDTFNAYKSVVILLLQYGDDADIQRLCDIQKKRVEEALKND